MKMNISDEAACWSTYNYELHMSYTYNYRSMGGQAARSLPVWCAPFIILKTRKMEAEWKLLCLQSRLMCYFSVLMSFVREIILVLSVICRRHFHLRSVGLCDTVLLHIFHTSHRESMWCTALRMNFLRVWCLLVRWRSADVFYFIDICFYLGLSNQSTVCIRHCTVSSLTTSPHDGVEL